MKYICCNVEPGTYGHECGKPADWLGDDKYGFCDHCKHNGHDRTSIKRWSKIDHDTKDSTHTITVNGRTCSRKWYGAHWGAWSAWS